MIDTPPAPSPQPPPHRRIALLDDDLAYIRVVERMLLTEGSEVQPITTLDVEEAVAVIEATGCTAAIVDVYMYGEALGFTLVRRIRENDGTSHLPVVVASGARREVGRKVSLLQDLRCTVLLKPFEPDELVAKLAEATTSVAAATQPAGLPVDTATVRLKNHRISQSIPGVTP